MKKLFSIVFLFILFTNCTKNNNQTEEIKDVVAKDTSTGVQSAPIKVTTDFAVTNVTNIIGNNVNVMLFPSLDAEVVFQLQENDSVRILGFSNEIDTIDNFSGRWLNISFLNNRSEYLSGWVFSKSINIGDIEPAPIKFVELMPNNNNPTRIRISYNLQDEEIFVDVFFTRWNEYNFFIWNSGEHGYHYTNIPGIYFLNRETLELKHFTYAGFNDGAVAWTKFTSDYKYIVQDSGTSTGIRGIAAWRCSDSKNIFQGLYYRESVLRGYTIDVAYVCSDWYFRNNRTDEEIMLYGEKYKEENPMPEDIVEGVNKGLFAELIVKCTVNIDTGERQILGAEYILTQ
jgi:hypothetical protein